jgi:AbrB family looped-hinge helix DNA binding protein
MQVVTISPKFQVVIPVKAGRALALQPGQKMQVIVNNSRRYISLCAAPAL